MVEQCGLTISCEDELKVLVLRERKGGCGKHLLRRGYGGDQEKVFYELTGRDEGAKVDAGKKVNCSWPNPFFLLTVSELHRPPLRLQRKGAGHVPCVVKFLLVSEDYVAKEGTMWMPPCVGELGLDGGKQGCD